MCKPCRADYSNALNASNPKPEKKLTLNTRKAHSVVVSHLQTSPLEAALHVEAFVGLGAVKDALRDN
jgi:hypothetical protein